MSFVLVLRQHSDGQHYLMHLEKYCVKGFLLTSNLTGVSTKSQQGEYKVHKPDESKSISMTDQHSLWCCNRIYFDSMCDEMELKELLGMSAPAFSTFKQFEDITSSKFSKTNML